MSSYVDKLPNMLKDIFENVYVIDNFATFENVPVSEIPDTS